MHRDLKPENVLLADDGRIKIGDFGLARAATANTATGNALLGTIAYLSPELVTRGIADTRSDIYSVGIMLYEMLAGEQPFKGEQPFQIAHQHATDSVPTPSSEEPRRARRTRRARAVGDRSGPRPAPARRGRDAEPAAGDPKAAAETSPAPPPRPCSTPRVMTAPRVPVQPSAETQILAAGLPTACRRRQARRPSTRTEREAAHQGVLAVQPRHAARRARRRHRLVLRLGTGRHGERAVGRRTRRVEAATAALKAADLTVAADVKTAYSIDVAPAW